MQKQMEMARSQIEFLKSLDTEEFYDKDEEEVKRYAHRVIQELILLGNQVTTELIELLQIEFTWSCFFALTIFRQTKDPQAVPALIAFLKRESDDSMANEEAMFALQDIGTPSILPLIEEIDESFDQKKYYSYLVGALTGIVGLEAYEFMVKITKDFIETPWRFKGWFHIEDFTFNFVKQGRTDAVPLLKQVLGLKSITGNEKREIEETLRALEDPVRYANDIQNIEKELADSRQKTGL